MWQGNLGRLTCEMSDVSDATPEDQNIICNVQCKQCSRASPQGKLSAGCHELSLLLLRDIVMARLHDTGVNQPTDHHAVQAQGYLHSSHTTASEGTS